jgi:hypothetical protein
MQKKQPVIQVNISYSGTCLAIGFMIWQLIVVAKSFPVMPGTYSTGNIVFFIHYIIPYAVNCSNIRTVACKGSHIGHSGVHVHCTYGMPHRLILLNYRFMGLAVFILTCGISATVKKIPCLF